MKNNKKKIVIIITLIIIILVTYYIFRNVSIEKHENSVNNYQDYTPQEEISDEQLRQTKVLLYFPNINTGELESEIKIVDANTLIKNPYKELVELIIKGPQSSNLIKIIPDGTILHDVTLENSCAIVNVSNEILNYETEENKLKMVNSIVNTLTNLKEVESVKFLINGESNEKLSETYIKNKV